MNNIISLRCMRKVFILSASFLLSLSACKKDGELTPEFAENTLSSFFTDSISIETSIRRGDSVLADKIATGLVGYYKDSVFGTTISSIYIQPLLPTNALVLEESNEFSEIDSIVLSLKYNSIFGDSSIDQTVEVFRLDEVLDADAFYYSDTNISVQPSALGVKTFKPQPDRVVTILNPNETGGIDTVKLDPQLRIRLDNSFGSEIISKSGQLELSNNSEFVKFFKGLKIAPNTNVIPNDNENAISYFALTSSDSKVTLYYRSINLNNDTSRKTIDFPINSSSVRFNTFEQNYTGSPVGEVLNKASMDSLFAFTQSMAGVETIIRFPRLKERFGNKNIIVNKAEIELPIVNASYAKFGVPNKLILATRDEFNLLQFIPDFFESEDYFGGDYNPLTGKYKFNIARYIQGVINGTEGDNGLTLLVSGGAVNAERVVLYSEKNASTKIKLNLYYSNTD